MDTVRADAPVRRPRIGLAAQGADQRIQFPGAEPPVHLGNQLGKVLGIALGQAAEHQQATDFAGLLARDRGKNGLDGLFLRVADEAAGVDELDVDGTRLPFRNDLIGIPDLIQEMLGVDGVLGAPQGDDLQRRHYASASGASSASSSSTKSKEAKSLSWLYQSTTFFMWDR